MDVEEKVGKKREDGGLWRRTVGHGQGRRDNDWGGWLEAQYVMKNAARICKLICRSGRRKSRKDTYVNRDNIPLSMLLATNVMKSDIPLDQLSNANFREVWVGVEVRMYDLR